MKYNKIKNNTKINNARWEDILYILKRIIIFLFTYQNLKIKYSIIFAIYLNEINSTEILDYEKSSHIF